jgi:alpha-galactosidase
MNRNVSEPGWPDAPTEPREVWVCYVQGFQVAPGSFQSAVRLIERL